MVPLTEPHPIPATAVTRRTDLQQPTGSLRRTDLRQPTGSLHRTDLQQPTGSLHRTDLRQATGSLHRTDYSNQLAACTEQTYSNQLAACADRPAATNWQPAQNRPTATNWRPALTDQPTQPISYITYNYRPSQQPMTNLYLAATSGPFIFCFLLARRQHVGGGGSCPPPGQLASRQHRVAGWAGCHWCQCRHHHGGLARLRGSLPAASTSVVAVLARLRGSLSAASTALRGRLGASRPAPRCGVGWVPLVPVPPPSRRSLPDRGAGCQAQPPPPTVVQANHRHHPATPRGADCDHGPCHVAGAAGSGPGRPGPESQHSGA